MTDTQPSKRTSGKKPGATPTVNVREEALGHATPAQTAETYTSVVADSELTGPQLRWYQLMTRATAHHDPSIRAVLSKHAPDADGHCEAEKCRRGLWPCPPAASVIPKLP